MTEPEPEPSGEREIEPAPSGEREIEAAPSGEREIEAEPSGERENEPEASGGREPNAPGPQPDGGEPEVVRSPVVASIVLGVAVGVFGGSFGVLATTSGLTVAKACAMSLLVFTGASQLTAVTVVAGGGSSAAALGSALLLAARNGAYGLAMAPILKGRLPTRLLASQLVIDESTAMATAQREEHHQRVAFWATGLAVFTFWNLGTLVGALAGSQIGSPASLGLDAAFPAGFVALLLPHLKRADGRRTALLGGLIALVLIPFVPAGVPVLAAALAALVGLGVPPRRRPETLPG